MIIRIFKHLHTINKHRWEVFKLCFRASIPYRGLVHDLSKYYPSEFIESIKYYTDGKKSPLKTCRERTGMSKAWLHHKGRNKHHIEYWYDYATVDKVLVMPLKYSIEMICDRIAAGKTYNKDFDKSNPLNYLYKEENSIQINPKIKNFMIDVFTEYKKYGDKIINKKTLTKIYNKHVNNTLKK